MLRFLFSRNCKPYLLVGLFLNCCMLLGAQSSAPARIDAVQGAVPRLDDDRVFAPFVSRLRVAVKEPQIRLTWQDIPDFTGSYQIFRYTEEIGLENLDKATMVSELLRRIPETVIHRCKLGLYIKLLWTYC